MLQTLSIVPHKRRLDSEWVCPAAIHTARECVTAKFQTSCIVRVFSSSSRKEAVSCESLYCVSRVEDHKFRNASRIRSSSSAHFASALLSQICCPTLSSPSCICTHELYEQRVDHMKTSSNMLLSGLVYRMVYRMPTSKIMQRTDEGVARTFLTVSTSTRCTIRSSNFCNSVGAMWAGECSALSSLNTSPHETAAPGAHSSSMHSNPSPDPHVRSSIGERAVAAWQFSIDLLAAWHMSRVLSCSLLWGVCRLQSRPSREQTSQTEHTEHTHARSCASHGYTCIKFQQRVATSTTGNVNALDAQETAGRQELRQSSSLGTISRSTARLRVPAARAPFQP